VAAYFIQEYKVGRTPNPDVLCNQHIKFGAFLEFARAHGADRIATGHYARRVPAGEGWALARGLDRNKDQSYFLWTLKPEQLSDADFPLGDATKDSVRAEAAAAGLPTAHKRDSQGICFLGHVDLREFLGQYMPLADGPVLDVEGHCIGTHHGAALYTLGQRHGFSISVTHHESQPRYVIDTNVNENTITVADTPPRMTPGRTIELSDTVLRESIVPGDTLDAVMRYRQAPSPVTVVTTEPNLMISPQVSIPLVPPGQSCVLYRGEYCIGGGIIRSHGSHHYES